MTVFGRLARQSSVYTLGNVLIKLSGLLLALLYLDTELFPKVLFGYLSVLEVTAQFAIALIGSGLTSGMFALLADPARREEHAIVPFTAMAANAFTAVAIMGLFWLASPVLARLLLEGPERAFLFRLLGVYALFKILGLVPFSWIRANERVGWYVTASVAEVVLLVGGVYYFLVHREMALEGVMWAYVLSSGVSAFVLCSSMLVRVKWRVDVGIIRRLVEYGTPLTLVGVALPFLHIGDRYLLQWLVGPEEVAVYSWAARLAGVLNTLVVQSMQLSFAVIGLKVLGESREGISVHRRMFRHFSIWAPWAVLGLSLFAYDVTILFSDTPQEYLPAVSQVLPLSMGVFLYGLYNITGNVLYAEGRTRVVGFGVLGAAVLNALLNLALIPPLGALGAALATLASYSVLMYAASWLVEKQFQIRFAWRVLLSALVIVIGLWLLGQPSREWDMAPRLLWRVVLLLSYPGIVLLAGLYRRDELAQVTAWLRERGRSVGGGS